MSTVGGVSRLLSLEEDRRSLPDAPETGQTARWGPPQGQHPAYTRPHKRGVRVMGVSQRPAHQPPRPVACPPPAPSTTWSRAVTLRALRGARPPNPLRRAGVKRQDSQTSPSPTSPMPVGRGLVDVAACGEADCSE